VTASTAVVLVAATWFVYRAARSRIPAPPPLASLGPLAPEVQDIVRQAREAVSDNPRDGLRWGRFGMVCEANGLVGAARDAYARAAVLQASEAKWWFHLASVEARLGKADDAVRDMRHATKLNPSYAPAFWRLGLWLLDQNETSGAERAFNTATEIDPADRAGWTGLARLYLQRGENARAAGLLERLIQAGAGGDRYVLQLLGTAYRRLGRTDESESALAVGATGEPQRTDPWTDEMAGFRRGYAALLKDATAYTVAGQFEPAIRILEQLRQQKPDDVVLMAQLGQVLVAAGHEEEAIPLLKRVVALEPERFEPYVDLATGHMHRGELAEAQAAVERALSLNPSYGRAHETHGLILWRAGDERAAIAALGTAVRIDPRNARALVWMGMVQTNLGRTEDALLSFERAVHTDPISADAWIGLANTQMNRHDLEAAGEALRRAEQIQADRPAVKETAERLKSLQTRTPQSSSRAAVPAPLEAPAGARRNPRSQ
jgi:tetratricopeptide (TPR) repeat protein